MRQDDLPWLPARLAQTEAGRAVTALLDVQPRNGTDQVILAWALSSLANTAGQQRDTRTRLAASQAAVDTIRKAESAQPAEPQHRQDLVYLLANLGHALTDAARPVAAMRAFDEATDLQRLIIASGLASEREARDTLASLLEDRDRAQQELLLGPQAPVNARLIP